MTSTLPSRPPNSSDGPDRRSREESPTDKKPVLELSVAQIVGGALAAMTAAFLGSTLGTGGTIIGAALASVIAGLAGAVYTASLRHTGNQVKRVFVSADPTDPTDPTGVLERIEETQVIPAQSVRAGKSSQSASPPKSGLALRAVFVTVAIFLLAGAGLTGYELLSGQALAGGTGTTITQVTESDGEAKQPAAEESKSPKSAAPTSAEPSPAPSSEAPDPAPTESTEPAEPSAKPTDSATPDVETTTP